LELAGGVRIEHGDLVVTARRGVHDVEREETRLEERVTAEQGTLWMRADRGWYWRNRDRALLEGNVHIRDRQWRIRCRRARLDRRNERVWLSGDVVAFDSTTSVNADSALYDSRTGGTEVFGAVRIVDLREGFRVTGEHGFYDRERREGWIDRNPHLVVDPEAPEPAEVDADTLRFYPDRKLAIAYGRVKIVKGETVTQCDSAVVRDSIGVAELYGRPLARQRRISMEARRMVLHYVGSEVDRIRLEG
jgi:lipopolysaccharide assembly outer membrane protein LptD (OstA)